MFAPKQKALSLPTRAQLNNLWLEARKKLGSSARLPLNPGSSARAVHLTVQCYRSSTQPRWQLESKYADSSKSLASSDLAAVSAWISESLCASNVIDMGTRRQGERDWNEPRAATSELGAEPSDPAEWQDVVPEETTGLESTWTHSPAAITGDLRHLPCNSLLQALSLAMVTGQLRIHSTHIGTVDWLKGSVTGCVWGSLRGQEALSEIAMLRAGRFSFKGGEHSSNSPAMSELQAKDCNTAAIPLGSVLIGAAHKEDQLELLTSVSFDELAMALIDSGFATSLASVSTESASIANDAGAAASAATTNRRAGKGGPSQWSITSKLIRHGGHKHVIFAMEILKQLQTTQLRLKEIQAATGLSATDLGATAATLIRAGMAEVYRISSGRKELIGSADINAADQLRLDENLEFIDNPNNQLQAILNDSRQTSLILIRGISTSTTTLLERIKRLLRRDDSVHLVEEDQLLVVMKDSSSTHGAHFVRRLRQVGVKEVLNRPSGKRKSSLSFRTAIVSAPEDGSTIGTLFDKASLAFEVTKRSGTINTPFSEGTLQERSTSV
jgi:hypothetical protein